MRRNNDEVVIGLFGGSVAQRVFRQLNKKLVAYGMQKGCDVTLLNFAIGAGKQPMQFSIFHTYIDSLDMTVNIDGHNEVAFDPGLNFPAHFPMFSEKLYSIDSEKLQNLKTMANSRVLQARFIGLLRENEWILRSKLLSLAGFGFIDRHEEKINRIDLWMRRQAGIVGMAPERFAKRQWQRLRTWQKYVRLQNQLALANDKKAVFFVQPTQYLNQDELAEKTLQILEPFRDKRVVDRYLIGYQRINSLVDDLKKEGVTIHSLSHLFADTEVPVFQDSCCHLNHAGNERLSESMFAKIKPLLDQRPCRKKRD